MHQSEGPPPNAHLHYHSLIVPPITDPFGPSVPSGEINVPWWWWWWGAGARGPENTANSNYHLQATLTPLGCSCAHLYLPPNTD